MPSINSFKISNFRGIKNAEINIKGKENNKVITLIGLNESGKTTVLEALSHFSTGDRTIPNLVSASREAEHFISLIPLEDKAAFTGDVKISTDILLTPEDQKRYLENCCRLTGFDVEYINPPDIVSVSKSFSFSDSRFQRATNFWSGVNLRYKTKRAKKFKNININVSSEKDIWLKIVNSIEAEIFEIVYFPTFLVEFPGRIYLESSEDEADVNVYYRTVLGHVLRHADNRLSLEKHVVDRVKSVKVKSKDSSWLSALYSGPEKELIDAVVGKIEAALNKEILGSWSKVFREPQSSRSIKVEWGVDTGKTDSVFFSISITDGTARYGIDERSLGFRWFFSYLLFTQFRAVGEKPTLFLFDEPAANLHAGAQVELLNSIGKIVSGKNRVIYSTHSPHMINPLWLDGAYIVENKAVDFDNAEDIYGFNTKPTNIVATRYPEFISKSPEKTSYFQPVLEKLMYSSPPIVGNGPYCLFEGVTDFHAFSYVMDITGKTKIRKIDLMPGMGAGAFEATIASLMGSGRKFLLVLDDDETGRKEAKRYVKEGILKEHQVKTYGELVSDCSGMDLEKIICAHSRKIIADKYSGKSGKKQVRMHVSELAAQKQPDGLDVGSINLMSRILTEIEMRLA